MKIYFCPIDPRPTFLEINSLLTDLQPKQIVIPQMYT
jgi:hypothetical protein